MSDYIGYGIRPDRARNAGTGWNAQRFCRYVLGHLDQGPRALFTRGQIDRIEREGVTIRAIPESPPGCDVAVFFYIHPDDEPIAVAAVREAARRERERETLRGLAAK